MPRLFQRLLTYDVLVQVYFVDHIRVQILPIATPSLLEFQFSSVVSNWRANFEIRVPKKKLLTHTYILYLYLVHNNKYKNFVDILRVIYTTLHPFNRAISHLTRASEYSTYN